MYLEIDTFKEPDEEFYIVLADAENAEIAPEDERKTGTILGTENPLSFTISDAYGYEGNTLLFDWKLDGYTDQPVKIILEVVDGSATLNLDYNAPVGYSLDSNRMFTLLDLPSGIQQAVTGTLQVPTIVDALAEGIENFFITLSPGNFLVDNEPYGGHTTGVGSIVDALPDLEVDNVTLKEGEVSVQRAYLTNPWYAPLKFDYVSQQNTATEGIDYSGFSGSITFEPGETEKWVVVGSLHDSDHNESTEDYNVVYTYDGGAPSIAGDSGTVFIEDVDAFPIYVTATNKYSHEPAGTPSTNNVNKINLDYGGFTFSRGEKQKILLAAAVGPCLPLRVAAEAVVEVIQQTTIPRNFK